MENETQSQEHFKINIEAIGKEINGDENGVEISGAVSLNCNLDFFIEAMVGVFENKERFACLMIAALAKYKGKNNVTFERVKQVLKGEAMDESNKKTEEKEPNV
jgi:hypothetical protein